MSKVAVITAASRGIGAASAVAFAKEGYDVVVNYKENNAAADKIVKDIKDLGQEAIAVKADVFTEEGVKELFRKVQENFGEIDILINNAGNPNEPKFGEYDYESIIESLSGTFVSAVLCTQYFAPLVKKGGSILFTSSIYGVDYGGNPGLALYSAGKAAIINFTQTMAEKLGPDIRCNVVAPGVTKTSGWDDVPKDYINQRLNMSLQKEWVGAEEIANAFVFLASNPHITGSTIVVDAGWMKKFPGK